MIADEVPERGAKQRRDGLPEVVGPMHLDTKGAPGRAVRAIGRHEIAGVVHFAGDKAVGESVAKPLKYYCNNLGGAVSLMQAMESAGCDTLVFSSSATVYGDPAHVPIA